MGVPLQAILGAKNVIGIIQSIKPGLQEKILPSGFLTSGQKTEGEQGSYFKVEGQRALARIALGGQGSPSKLREMKGLSEVPVKLMHTIESHFIKPNAMLNLLDTEAGPNGVPSTKQKNGMREVAREQKDFAQLFYNLRVAAVFSIITNGKIWIDANGEMLTSSLGAVITIDFGVPAGNKGQVGSIISASWGTAGTDIIGQLQSLQQKAVESTGYVLEEAFYGKNVIKYILSNTVIQQYMKFNQQFSNDLRVNGVIPDGFLGLRWHPFNWAFFAKNLANSGAAIANETILRFLSSSTVAASGTYTPNDDAVIFTPAPTEDFWDMLEGSTLVPNDTGIAADAMSALEDFELAYGMFNYAVKMTDPATIKIVGGDTFLPVLKVPGAIYQTNVHFV